jgi:hypothetical protein
MEGRGTIVQAVLGQPQQGINNVLVKDIKFEML